MGTLNIAAYGEGIMYVPSLKANMAAIQSAGWTSVILGLFHINSSNQDIVFNDTAVISGGSYVGAEQWPQQVAQLLEPSAGNTIQTLLASFGGGGVTDFATVKAIYEANGNSFSGTQLESNLQAMRQAFPSVSLMDMDVEDTYDQPSFVAFCQMLIGMGWGITFCPYEAQEFWTGSLAALNASDPGAVKWWNLQTYDGGARNVPDQWATAIADAIPGFDTTGFILPGDWSRLLAKPNPNMRETWFWNGDCPPAVQSHLARFAGQASVGGGFIWNLDQILNYGFNEEQKPDPDPCGLVDMASYVQAISGALG